MRSSIIEHIVLAKQVTRHAALHCSLLLLVAILGSQDRGSAPHDSCLHGVNFVLPRSLLDSKLLIKSCQPQSPNAILSRSCESSLGVCWCSHDCTCLRQGKSPATRLAKAAYTSFEPSNFTEVSKLECQHDLFGLHPGQEPISWADLIVLSAKVAHVLAWTQQKVKRSTVASGGSTIADAFGAAFPVPLGRVDATTADEPVKIPTQSASPAEIKVRQGKGKAMQTGPYSSTGPVSICCHSFMASAVCDAQHKTMPCPISISRMWFCFLWLANLQLTLLSVLLVVTFTPPHSDVPCYTRAHFGWYFSTSCQRTSPPATAL